MIMLCGYNDGGDTGLQCDLDYFLKELQFSFVAIIFGFICSIVVVVAAALLFWIWMLFVFLGGNCDGSCVSAGLDWTGLQYVLVSE